MPYPSRKIRCIRACTHQRPQKIKDQYAVSRGFNTPYSSYEINIIFCKISNVVPTPRNPQYAVKMDNPNITMEEYIRLEEEKARRRATLSCEPMVSSLNNDEIDFRISFDEPDDEDCTVSIRRILGNGYGILTSYTVLEPRERKIDDVGDVFTNMEILKCWSLETSKRLELRDFISAINLACVLLLSSSYPSICLGFGEDCQLRHLVAGKA
ncbi:hypothetical protein Tco_0209201 [Tanacetum coccineum]